jgi:hypothetical protein
MWAMIEKLRMCFTEFHFSSVMLATSAMRALMSARTTRYSTGTGLRLAVFVRQPSQDLT